MENCAWINEWRKRPKKADRKVVQMENCQSKKSWLHATLQGVSLSVSICPVIRCPFASLSVTNFHLMDCKALSVCCNQLKRVFPAPPVAVVVAVTVTVTPALELSCFHPSLLSSAMLVPNALSQPRVAHKSYKSVALIIRLLPYAFCSLSLTSTQSQKVALTIELRTEGLGQGPGLALRLAIGVGVTS